MTTSSHPRLNKEVYLGSDRESDIERLLGELEAADVQCVIDLRLGLSRSDIALIELGAQSRHMHFAYLPELAEAPEAAGQPSRALAWAARTALRYRTCLLTQGRSKETDGARQIAALVGLRLVSLGEISDSEETAG